MIRDMLQKTGETISAPQSPLMWETTFARIANALNDHPIAKSNQSNLSSDNFDIITPNRLILGRNSARGLPMEGLDLETSANLQRVLARSHDIFAAWFRIYMENIHLLNTASTLKWTKSAPLPVIGDVVLFVATESAGGSKKDGVWKIGRVVSVKERRVMIEQVLKSGTKTVLERNPRDVSVIAGVEEVSINSQDYFNRLLGATSKSPSAAPL